MKLDRELTKVFREVYKDYTKWYYNKNFRPRSLTVKYKYPCLYIRWKNDLNRRWEYIRVASKDQISHFLHAHQKYWEELEPLLKYYPEQLLNADISVIASCYLGLIVNPAEYLFSDNKKIRQIARQFCNIIKDARV